MNKKIKIINILHSPPRIIKNYDEFNYAEFINKITPEEYIKIRKPPFWIGFFKMDHHISFAKKIQEKTEKYQMECWRPYGDIIDEIYTKRVDGVIHRVFPSKKYYIYALGTWMKSKAMLNELKKENRENKIIVVFHDGHSRFVRWLILKLKKENIPMVYIHLSSSFSIFKYKKSPFLKKLNITRLYDHIKEMQALRNIDLYVAAAITEKNFLEKKSFKNYIYRVQGIDISLFNKINDKENIRKKLGLPLDKKILLFVSWFTRVYALDILIKTYIKIKKKKSNIELVMVGGSKTDEFYQMGIDSGAIVVERVKPEVLVKYYQSADIFVMPYINYTVVNFGGLGNTIAESAACGLPIISNNLIHFPGTLEERKNLGEVMGTENDLEIKIYNMLKNLDNYRECREIAKKYFDMRDSVRMYINKFDEISKKYYGGKVNDK